MQEGNRCSKVRIMSNVWRGALNQIIIVLGIMAAWQELIKFDKTSTNISFPITGAYQSLRPKKFSSPSLVSLSLIKVAIALFPTYANYLNTRFQLDTSSYNLPRECFEAADDKEE